jgi:hypothetical protein
MKQEQDVIQKEHSTTKNKLLEIRHEISIEELKNKVKKFIQTDKRERKRDRKRERKSKKNQKITAGRRKWEMEGQQSQCNKKRGGARGTWGRGWTETPTHWRRHCLGGQGCWSQELREQRCWWLGCCQEAPL